MKKLLCDGKWEIVEVGEEWKRERKWKRGEEVEGEVEVDL